jgi:hypothetical protein
MAGGGRLAASVKYFEEELEFITSLETHLKSVADKISSMLEGDAEVHVSSLDGTDWRQEKAATSAVDMTQQKIMHLLEELSRQKKCLYDEEAYARHMDKIEKIQEFVRRVILWRRVRRFIESPENAMGRQRYKVQREIIETEAKYEKHLTILSTVFAENIKSSGAVSADDRRTIFSNCEAILQCSRVFLSRISPAKATSSSSHRTSLLLSSSSPSPSSLMSTVHFGKIFVELGPFFKLYVPPSSFLSCLFSLIFSLLSFLSPFSSFSSSFFTLVEIDRFISFHLLLSTPLFLWALQIFGVCRQL